MDMKTLPRIRPGIGEGSLLTVWHGEPRWPSMVGEDRAENEKKMEQDITVTLSRYN